MFKMMIKSIKTDGSASNLRLFLQYSPLHRHRTCTPVCRFSSCNRDIFSVPRDTGRLQRHI